VYSFVKDHRGGIVPAIIDGTNTARPLHSLYNPQKEAERLIGTLKDEGFLIFLGLGGGFFIEEALKKTSVQQILVIDYGKAGIAELFAHGDYSRIMGDPRTRLLVDPSPDEIERFILEQYQPVLMNGIRSFPLRARIDASPELFASTEGAVRSAIAKVTADFSVQAHFGLQWFSNIVKNMSRMDERAAAETSSAAFATNMGGIGAKLDAKARLGTGRLTEIESAAVIAAGPSLDEQIPLLKQKKRFIIATDTSLPSLLARGIEPDAVISIDCQIWSYNHFMTSPELPPKTRLFVDLASPPAVAERSTRPCFFSGGHPLTRYISRYWLDLPELDTSGGNVTYAAVSLAEYLGAKIVELFGADFSYPLGKTYARGTWLFPFYEKQQSRFSPTETLFSDLVYRTPVRKIRPQQEMQTQNPPHEPAHTEDWYYETATLAMYRNRLENASRRARLIPIAGLGAIINPCNPPPDSAKVATVQSRQPVQSPQTAPRMTASQFMAEYCGKIRRLPSPADDENHILLWTLLPTAAAIKHRNPDMNAKDVLDATREYCTAKLGYF
jgi:hypothetical protein